MVKLIKCLLIFCLDLAMNLIENGYPEISSLLVIYFFLHMYKRQTDEEREVHPAEELGKEPRFLTSCPV